MTANFKKKRGYAWSHRALLLAGLSVVAAAFAFVAPMDARAQDTQAMPGMEMDSAQPSVRDDESMKDRHPHPATGADHSQMKGMDHSQTQGMDMGAMQGGSAPPDARDPNAYADGLSAGPMPGMDMADDKPYGRLLLNKLEHADRDRALRLEGEAWYGGDYNKLWLKVDAGRARDGLTASRLELLWDRNVATYWSSQMGIRHDVGEGPARNWVAVGMQGLAPYWFEMEATAYVGQGNRTAARLNIDYELLFTQRLILQPNLEMNLYGKSDPARAIGAGLSDIDLGARLRYEITRQFAPYIGVTWNRKFGDTADFAQAVHLDARDTVLVVGIRMWF